MLQKFIIGFSIFASSALIMVALSVGGTTEVTSADGSQVIREENGTQIIHILARGGYSPKTVTAEAGKPTVLEVETKGTYDCSASLTIPAIGYDEQLSPTGVTMVTIPSQSPGTEMEGLCSMGMFSFTIKFS